METTRGHLENHLQESLPNDKRIIRNTRYGNEFEIGEPHPDTGQPMTRDDVCDLFEERQLPFMDVEPLRGKRLLCYCKPNQRCHADSIIKKLGETKGMIGHNSVVVRPNSGELERIAEEAKLGLAQVHKGEEDTIDGWLQYGAALNEGREMFPSDEQFGQWVRETQLDAHASKDERTAAMWAASNQEEFLKVKADNPRVRTVRGLHAKWKEEKKAEGQEIRVPSSREIATIKKIQELVDRGATEGERTAAKAMLDKVIAESGLINLDDVVLQEECNNTVSDREYLAEKIVETVLKNLHKEPAKDYLTLIVLDAFKDDAMLKREFEGLMREVEIW